MSNNMNTNLNKTNSSSNNSNSEIAMNAYMHVVNNASFFSLTAVGVPVNRARVIVQNRPLTSIEQVEDLYGVGPATIALIQRAVTDGSLTADGVSDEEAERALGTAVTTEMLHELLGEVGTEWYQSRKVSVLGRYIELAETPRGPTWAEREEAYQLMVDVKTGVVPVNAQTIKEEEHDFYSTTDEAYWAGKDEDRVVVENAAKEVEDFNWILRDYRETGKPPKKVLAETRSLNWSLDFRKAVHTKGEVKAARALGVREACIDDSKKTRLATSYLRSEYWAAVKAERQRRRVAKANKVRYIGAMANYLLDNYVERVWTGKRWQKLSPDETSEIWTTDTNIMALEEAMVRKGRPVPLVSVTLNKAWAPESYWTRGGKVCICVDEVDWKEGYSCGDMEVMSAGRTRHFHEEVGIESWGTEGETSSRKRGMSNAIFLVIPR